MEGWTPIQSFYWTVITSASIGYGEFALSSQLSRALGVIFIPTSVLVISAALAGIVNVFLEDQIASVNQKLIARELTVDDLAFMNTDADGEVSELEFVTFMLKTMKKVDQSLIDDLRSRFKKLDVDGSGSLAKNDIELLTKKKLAMQRKVTLAHYKQDLSKSTPTVFGISMKLKDKYKVSPFGTTPSDRSGALRRCSNDAV